MFANLIAATTAFPTAIYTVLLGVVLVYWLLAIVGMVDFESSGIDLDIEAHADASADDLGAIASYVVAFGLNGVPFSIVVSLLVLVGWTLSCIAGVTLQAWIPTDILRWVAGLGILAVSAALSLVITARIVRPLRGLFVHHTAQSNASLVGQTCKVLTGVVDERQGRAEVAQRGASINIRVWSPSPNPLRRGDTALITDYDAGTHRYLVMPLPPT